MSNSIAPGSSADVNVKVTALTTNPNVPVTYKTIILKKNLVNGVNTLTQEMISNENIKYIIKYDYVLNKDITIPSNCILEFDGGSIDGGSIILSDNNTICGKGKISKNSQLGATEIIRIAEANNIIIKDVEIYSDIVYKTTDTSEKVVVGIQTLYQTNLKIENCHIHNVSAAIGLDTSHKVSIINNYISDCYSIAYSGGSIDRGIYGYGVVPNQSEDVIISNNIFNNIERHALYVSSHVSLEGVNAKNIMFDNNIVNQLNINSTDRKTGAEYMLKVIAGNNITISNNTVNCYKGILLDAHEMGLNGGNVSIHNNIINSEGNFLATFPSVNGTNGWSELKVYDNIGKLTSIYSEAFILCNIDTVKVYNNHIENISLNGAVAIEFRNNIENYVNSIRFTKKAIFKDNVFAGFKGYISMSWITELISSDSIDETSTIVQEPQTIDPINQVEKFNITLSPYNNYKDYKRRIGNKYNIGLRYFDRDLNEYIKCVSYADNIWDNDKNIHVTGGVNHRPPIKNSFIGQKFAQIISGQNIVILTFTGMEWSDNNTIIPELVETVSDLLAITSPRNYCNLPIYCVETKKPYWFDAYTLKWKDAMGNELTA